MSLYGCIVNQSANKEIRLCSGSDAEIDFGESKAIHPIFTQWFFTSVTNETTRIAKFLSTPPSSLPSIKIEKTEGSKEISICDVPFYKGYPEVHIVFKDDTGKIHDRIQVTENIPVYQCCFDGLATMCMDRTKPLCTTIISGENTFKQGECQECFVITALSWVFLLFQIYFVHVILNWKGRGGCKYRRAVFIAFGIGSTLPMFLPSMFLKLHTYRARGLILPTAFFSNNRESKQIILLLDEDKVFGEHKKELLANQRVESTQANIVHSEQQNVSNLEQNS
ncbi:hypothetical protein KUTeg_006176 [Tegillarca granosa]|uniref:Uncharacterized protein n=1 Tax=Tegillarca granosa TaxID=220873 RepID=A0ABQ9FFQ2_TEGGR|nr:hypothetical protein KUTeg_006176 [Tegillarca granosa]